MSGSAGRSKGSAEKGKREEMTLESTRTKSGALSASPGAAEEQSTTVLHSSSTSAEVHSAPQEHFLNRIGGGGKKGCWSAPSSVDKKPSHDNAEPFP